MRFRTALEFVEQHATNLSRGGIFIRTDHPPAMDTVVDVEVQLPDSGAPVISAGIVVHREEPGRSNNPGVGVQFVDASDAFRERLDRYMDSLMNVKSWAQG